MNSSFCFLVNTLSGRGKASALLDGRLDYVKNKFPDSHFIFIRDDDVIKEHAKRASAQHKYVVAIGGDGTVQQVAAGVFGTDAVMGVLPLGSGNDFAKSIGLTLQFEKDLDILLNKKTELIDVVRTDNDLILNTFGVGLDGLTNYYSEKSSLKYTTLRYFISALKAIIRSDLFSYECVIDGKRIEGKSWMIVAANGPFEGGRYEISPESDNSDGIVEVVIIRDVPVLRILVEFLKLSAGISFSDEIALKKTCRSSLSITLDKAVYGHADGEIIPPADNFNLSILKQAIPVITGR